MKTDFIKIEILNWSTYNPRTDVKRPSWFRLENSLIEDPRFFSWSGDQFKAMIYILSRASQRNRAIVEIYPEHAHRVCHIPERALSEVIKKLEEFEVLTVHDTQTSRGRNEDVQIAFATNVRTYGTERNGTNGTLAPSDSSNRLEAHGCLSEFSGIGEIIRERGVTREQQSAWLAAFPDAPWICDQARRAVAWEASNPKNRKKRFSRFMHNWLTSAWDKRRGTSPTPITPLGARARNAPRRKTGDEIIAEARARAEAEMRASGEIP